MDSTAWFPANGAATVSEFPQLCRALEKALLRVRVVRENLESEATGCRTNAPRPLQLRKGHHKTTFLCRSPHDIFTEALPISGRHVAVPPGKSRHCGYSRRSDLCAKSLYSPSLGCETWRFLQWSCAKPRKEGVKVYATLKLQQTGPWKLEMAPYRDERPETKQSWVCAEAEATRSGVSNFMAMSQGMLRAR